MKKNNWTAGAMLLFSAAAGAAAIPIPRCAGGTAGCSGAAEASCEFSAAVVVNLLIDLAHAAFA